MGFVPTPVKERRRRHTIPPPRTPAHHPPPPPGPVLTGELLTLATIQFWWAPPSNVTVKIKKN
ncbi:hypothetical protein HanIR_Chr05g0254151 [Helianthus annuus]|nr:hypothetical protein HanIR_Chr05g0254151 [Helianthus annuus]